MMGDCVLSQELMVCGDAVYGSCWTGNSAFGNKHGEFNHPHRKATMLCLIQLQIIIYIHCKPQ